MLMVVLDWFQVEFLSKVQSWRTKVLFNWGRSSYAHLFLKLSEEQNNAAYFYDLNTKINYKFDANNSVYLSGYFGRDVFSLNNSFTNI
jgi:hypothetical protein